MDRFIRVATATLLLTSAYPVTADLMPYIVGGNDADAGEYPFIAALVYADSSSNFSGQFCGGTVVAEHWVLTAAHCVMQEKAADIKVVAGSTELSLTDTQGRLSLNAIVPHPGYAPSTLANDIALLHLRRPAEVVPVQLDDGSLLPMMNLLDPVTAIGWGDTLGTPPYPDTLQEVELEYIPHPDCNTDYYDGTLNDSNFCAGIVGSGGKDTCSGDSGGPLLLDVGGDWYQIGITSFGDDAGCALADFPGAYSATGYFRAWIARTLASTDLTARLETRNSGSNPLTLIARLENQAQVPAADAQLAIRASAGVVLASDDPACSTRGADLDCRFDELDGGASRQVVFTASFTTAGAQSVSARAVTATRDFDPADNLASVTVSTLGGGSGDDGGSIGIIPLLALTLLSRRRPKPTARP